MTKDSDGNIVVRKNSKSAMEYEGNELIISARKSASQVVVHSAGGMQALLYRRGGVRAPRGWLGRVHGPRGWRGWDAGVTGGEAGLETMVDGVDLIEYVVMHLLREACFWHLIQGKEIEGCVDDGVMGRMRAVRCSGSWRVRRGRAI